MDWILPKVAIFLYRSTVQRSLTKIRPSENFSELTKMWSTGPILNNISLKVKILKTDSQMASTWPLASQLLSKFLRKVHHTFKSDNWKWTVITELQKNGHWHFHFLSTPLIPYTHNCTLNKNFTSCWNCQAYLSKLWPWGRVESRSTGQKTISQYLAKYPVQF